MQVKKQELQLNIELVPNWESQGCILSKCLFNLYAEYIMKNAGLDESKLESRLLGKVSTTLEMQITTL